MFARWVRILRFNGRYNRTKTIKFRCCGTESGHYDALKQFRSDGDIKHFILDNTEVVKNNTLTPEISLRLFTPKCRFWNERPELWPFTDPYWAIYWPGGQALARYLLNDPGVARDRKVLDLGSGCGGAAIAAKMCGASYVLANDIDRVAAIATNLNCELNGLKALPSTTENLIGSELTGWDLILLGDMFYEEALADSLHPWLQHCIQTRNTQVLIGDPGRAHLESHRIREHLRPLACFPLPEAVRDENYGLTSCSVWRFEPNL